MATRSQLTLLIIPPAYVLKQNSNFRFDVLFILEVSLEKSGVKAESDQRGITGCFLHVLVLDKYERNHAMKSHTNFQC